jgi:hypothetical protein
MLINEIITEHGRIVKGSNTTADVDVDSIIKQAKKLGFTVNKDGYPPLLHEYKLSEEELERVSMGMGLEAFQNSDIAFAGGVRSGSSHAGLTRLKYIIYDVGAATNAEIDVEDYERGFVELFMDDATRDIVGLVNIKITKPGNRKAGLGGAVITSLLDSPFVKKPFRIYDIQRAAIPFWKKMGAKFVKMDWLTPISDPSSPRHIGFVQGIIGG